MFQEQTDLCYSRDLSCDSIISLEETMLTPKSAKMLESPFTWQISGACGILASSESV